MQSLTMAMALKVKGGGFALRHRHDFLTAASTKRRHYLLIFGGHGYRQDFLISHQ
ncbi:hypothetical protein M6B38_371125 [Iris pallida]|uniref:Uncharacterized protein n=1 Tax=Iris pallida TaxID=29817 RepID=A0AAX6GD29_IRIPA|nr:hypothetical protein M6B38_371125 [Iris pallida]